MPTEPSPYVGSAAHYLRGRPPYSRELGAVLARELGLDGGGHLLDVGCGPGTLAVELAPLFERVTAIDPDEGMVIEARRHALDRGAGNVEAFVSRAEELPELGLPPMRVVTFGQSFHWVDRDAVTEHVLELLGPGGAIVLVTHDIDGQPQPAGPGDPPIPDDEIQQIIASYLGPDYRATNRTWGPDDRYEAALAGTRFGHARTVHAPGREDITRDIDGVISGYLSMSYAAPHRFGDRLDEFVAEVHALLEARTPTGRFWDWPGATALIIATKPG